MTLHIYDQIRGPNSIKELIKQWKTVEKHDKLLLSKAIIEAVINLIGFNYEPTNEEIEEPEGREKYRRIVRKMVDSSYEHTRCIIEGADKDKFISRFDSFVDKVVGSIEASECEWLTALVRFTGELMENEHDMPDTVMIAVFVRVIFLKHLTTYRRKLENSNPPLVEMIVRTCNILCKTLHRGVTFKDIHEIYVDISLALFRKNPDYYILDYDHLEELEAFLNMDNLKTIEKSYETLRALMDGNIVDDMELREHVREAIANFFEARLNSLFYKMILHKRITVSKEAFQLLLSVQKFRGKTSIFKNKEYQKEVNLAFTHPSKTIRPFAMEYMKITMSPLEILKFVLISVEKYEMPISEIVTSVYDRTIFSQWNVYLTYLQKAPDNPRPVTVVTQIIRAVLMILTRDYHEEMKRNANPSDLLDAQYEILDFILIYPKFLQFYRVSQTHPVRYMKCVDMINVLPLKDFVANISFELVGELMTEYELGLNAFETFYTINGTMNAVLNLRFHFPQLEDSVDMIVASESTKFIDESILSTEEGRTQHKRATYIMYACIATQLLELVADDQYEAVVIDDMDRMVNEQFLEHIPAKGAFLAVWAKILEKCFKIAVNRIRETQQDEGPISLKNVQTKMKRVLELMQNQMNSAMRFKTVSLYSDMNLIVQTAGEFLHFLSIDQTAVDPVMFTSIFTSMTRLTEMLLLNTQYSQCVTTLTDFYDFKYNLVTNHMEIHHILQHLGDPTVQKHHEVMKRLTSVAYSRDASQDKKTFRMTIAQAIISLAGENNAEANIALFWKAFQSILTSTLKLQRKEFLLLIANLAFEILQMKLKEPIDEISNRFFVFDVFPQIIEEIKKSQAVTTSVTDAFTQVQTKHATDFTPDENQSLKKFITKFNTEN